MNKHLIHITILGVVLGAIGTVPLFLLFSDHIDYNPRSTRDKTFHIISDGKDEECLKNKPYGDANLECSFQVIKECSCKGRLEDDNNCTGLRTDCLGEEYDCNYTKSPGILIPKPFC